MFGKSALWGSFLYTLGFFGFLFALALAAMTEPLLIILILFLAMWVMVYMVSA